MEPTVPAAVRPLRDRIVLRVRDDQKRSASGLHLPSSPEEVVRATVVAVGEGLVTQDGTPIPLSVKPNDVVVIRKYQERGDDKKIAVGDKLKVGYDDHGNPLEYTVVHERDIICVVQE